MRHAIGVLLGLLLAPLLLGLAGWGFVRATHVGAVLDPKSAEVLSGLALLAAAGLVIAALAAARWLPPSAALVVGLAFVGVTAFYILALARFTDLLEPRGEVGAGVFGFVRTGAAGMVGVALLLAAAMPHRWVAPSRAGAADAPEQPYAELPPYQAGGYSAPGSSTTGYAGTGYAGTSDYPTSDYPTSGYSAPGYSQSGYAQPGYSQSGGYSSPGSAQSGYPTRRGQHRATEGTSNPPYYDEPAS